ncbi:MAG: insulinase family protein [Spirochaetaceae bacterium]|jgi:zinc protease|nr:insulinase family protein [Spirochaetaceae bacterium]
MPVPAFLFFLVLITISVLYSCASGPGRYGTGRAGDAIPFMHEARSGTLPNGLSYYILKNSKPENRAFLALAVRAGSVMEEDSEQGLAHFVEHMGFNGTARFPQAQLRDYLRSLGMRFGAHLNAYTYFDETVYSLETPVETDAATGIKRVPARALAILDDWSHAMTFDPEEVDAERSIILEEYRTRLGAGERVSRQLLQAILRGSIYPQRRPIGLPEIIQNAPAEQLVNFYRKWYRPDNMAIILVGDFDDEALEQSLAAHFTAPEPAVPPPALPNTELPPPVKNNTHVAIITDPEYSYTRIDAYYKLESAARGTDLASYRNDIMRGLIEQIISRRFDETADNPDTPYASAGAWEERFGGTGRFYVMAAVAKPGSARESLRAILREKESIFRYGFTAPEIETAKRALISNFRQQLSERDRQESASYISRFTSHFLRDISMPDIAWELETVESLLPGITARDLAAMARSFFKTGDLTLTIIAPEAEAEALPAEAEVREIIAASSRARIARPAEYASKGDLVAGEPGAGSIVSVQTDNASGAHIITLSNGASVIVKTTANKNNEIVLYAVSRGGSASVPPEEAWSAYLAPELAQASGLGPYRRAELAERLAEKQVSLSFWTSRLSRGFQGSSTREDIRTLFELLYLGFTEPRIDNDAVRVVADQYRTQLARRNENPDQYFSDEVTRIVYGNNPWIRPMTMEDINGISIDAAARFIKRAANPADYTFVFTGNVDVEFIAPYLETWLASIPAGTAAWNAWPNPGIARPGKAEHQFYRGREEKSTVVLCWFMPQSWTPEAYTAAAVLSEYLDIVLIDEIREKLGGVYSIGASAAISSVPPPGEAILQSSFACDPGRAVELSDAVIREFEKIARGQIDPGNFAKAVDALKKGWEESMQSNYFISQNYATLRATLDMPLEYLHSLPGRYDAVRQADVQNFCRALLPRGPLRMILYPETNR